MLLGVVAISSFIVDLSFYRLRTHHTHSDGTVIEEANAGSGQNGRGEPRASSSTAGAWLLQTRYVAVLFPTSNQSSFFLRNFYDLMIFLSDKGIKKRRHVHNVSIISNVIS